MATDPILQSFLTLFVVVDPVGVAVLFLGLAGNGGPEAQGGVYGSILLVSLIAYISLVAAERIFRLLGQTGINVVTRILCILLAALAVQYVADGAKGLWI